MPAGELPISLPSRIIPRHAVIFPAGMTLANFSTDILPADIPTVEQAIKDHQELGRYPLEPLHARTVDGQKLWKMRINGSKNKGIRVLVTHQGHSRYMVERIKYRGKAYKDL